MAQQETQIERRLQSLETHLKQEMEILADVVHSFRKLDHVAYRLGILDEEQSYANRVSWWPMIAILGTFSAGKSTFINDYLDNNHLQRTGNQAVDDKFTVICYNGDAKQNTAHSVNILPGVALDSDPRFPFYQIGREIAEIAAVGSERIDAYLQLKTCPSEKLRGKILIDSPGFDADSQRTSTLRITNHIINLSDLVLVFFDARRPEPGAMHDTLQHLVTGTIDRPDSNKFLYILNQMDVTAREDNPEEVVAAWQRSLAQSGLTAGRFYRIYSTKVAVPIEDPVVRERFERKRDNDMKEINTRMEQVSVERAYRIVGVLERAVKDIEYRIVPQLQELIQRWKQRVCLTDGFLLLLALLIGIGINTQVNFVHYFTADNTTLWAITGGIAILLALFTHFKVRRWAANKLLRQLNRDIHDESLRESLKRGLVKNTTPWRPLFLNQPCGWGKKTRSKLYGLLSDANSYVQSLNDRFANTAGSKQAEPIKVQNK